MQPLRGCTSAEPYGEAAMTDMAEIPFEHTYAGLGDAFSTACAPTPVAAPSLIAFNWALAEQLNIHLPRSTSPGPVFQRQSVIASARGL